MKKKLLLVAVMMAILACLFVLSVSAAGSTTDEFGIAETLDGIPVDLTDTTSRVVLKGSDGLFRTFPSSYIYFKTGAGNWSWRGEAKCTFEYINTALGLTEENAYTIDSIIRIEVPDDLKYIEGFSGKVNLKEMYFSPTSEMTNMRPMGNKCGIEKITMPPKQTSYPEFLFHTCPNLTTVIFYENENLTSLPKEMFKACTSLVEFTFPSSVTSMGASFFSGCTSLKRVTLSPGITSIGNSFSYLKNLEYVNTENITSFSNKAFQDCEKLDGIVINEAVATIPNDFCKNCKSLTSIVIPSNVTAIKGYAFDGCYKLTSVTNYAENITSIDGNAFSGCPITEFNFPDNLTSIGQYAFSGAQFTEVDLPSTITSLGTGCFQGCTKLTYVRIPELVEQVPHDFLKGTQSSQITIVVPKGCTSIYSQYSLVNSGITKIIFTGSMDDDFVADVQKQASGWVSKIVCENHCDHYYDGVHEEDNNPCVINCTRCNSVNQPEKNPEHSISTTITYVSFAKDGEKITGCVNEGCTHKTTETAPALFTCTGFSASQTGTNGIVLGFKVNQEAIDTYTSATGNTIKYGVFVGTQASLGNSDLSDESLSDKVIIAEIKQTDFAVFDIKIMGFETEDQKSASLAIGGYVAETDDEGTTYSYMQLGTPSEGERYCYDTYNNIVSALN